jgi:putative oxidoreductase
MVKESQLHLSLLLLRLSIFLVMAMWTVDKFVNPQHAIAVYENFYLLSGLGAQVMLIIGIAEGLLLLAFVAGFVRTWSYGLVLVLHAVSTLSSYRQYLDPFEGPNLLFFAAWPMLAACVALFLLRDHDRLLSLRTR